MLFGRRRSEPLRGAGGEVGLEGLHGGHGLVSERNGREHTLSLTHTHSHTHTHTHTTPSCLVRETPNVDPTPPSFGRSAPPLPLPGVDEARCGYTRVWAAPQSHALRQPLCIEAPKTSKTGRYTQARQVDTTRTGRYTQPRTRAVRDDKCSRKQQMGSQTEEEMGKTGWARSLFLARSLDRRTHTPTLTWTTLHATTYNTATGINALSFFRAISFFSFPSLHLGQRRPSATGKPDYRLGGPGGILEVQVSLSLSLPSLFLSGAGPWGAAD
ncbi:hypothetical protein VTK73DRAFT_5844 [Phialemonium thermophilum]|uniref:Uncharacterized protein n=1 Tax=Phialemonium thermophilum TaxID=223376 RepID=A0ABR3V1K7_9PEZI